MSGHQAIAASAPIASPTIRVPPVSRLSSQIEPSSPKPSSAHLAVVLADAHGPVLGKDQPSANLSLLYLAGHLRKYAPAVSIRYISQKPPLEHHLRVIEETQASIYAISFTSFSAAVAFDMIRTIKRRFPHVLIVIGGPHVTTHAEQALRNSGADLCVIGEGEMTFLEIVDRYPSLPEARPTIDGIAYLQGNRLVRNRPRRLIADIDLIPTPHRGLIDQREFTGTSYSKGHPNTEVIATRGCPLRCVFCANPVYRIDGGPLFRARSPQSIAQEVEDLYRMGYREIYFHSDELNVRLGWAIELCKTLTALGHRDLFFQCNMRVVPMNEELAHWMARANFWLVRVGIESANMRVLRGIRKRMSLEKIERACELWSRAGIRVFAFLMMFNAWEEDGRLENETPGEVRNTRRYIYRLWLKRRIHYASWQIAVPVPGAELHDLMVKHRKIDPSYLPDHDWRPDEHFNNLTTRAFRSTYRSALRQEALMALLGGNVEWRNWRRIANNARMMLLGPGLRSRTEAPPLQSPGGQRCALMASTTPGQITMTDSQPHDDSGVSIRESGAIQSHTTT